MTSILILFLSGAIGALTKEIIDDNKLTLPKKVDGDFCLGFLGSCVIGGIAGYLVDGNPVTAGLAGYAGKSVIESFLAKKNEILVPADGITESLIRKIAADETVDPDLAVRVAKCESGFNWNATRTNTDGSRDRGLYQINSKYHPEVSDAEAFDPIFSTKFFCKAFKAGHLDWWNWSKDCWNK
jgi:hypothetical protein